MRLILFTLSVVFVILLSIFVFIFLGNTNQNRNIPSSPTVVNPTLIPYKDTSSPSSGITYDTAKSNKLIELSKNKTLLSSAGQEAKQRIVARLDNKPGGILTTQNVKISYTPSMDAFTGEIISIDISKAKSDAVTFMLSQGFTKEDVCKLPLSFYLGSEIKSALSNSGLIFNPLPEGC